MHKHNRRNVSISRRLMRQASEPTAAMPASSPPIDTLAEKPTEEITSELKNTAALTWEPRGKQVRNLTTICRAAALSSHVGLLQACVGGFLGSFMAALYLSDWCGVHGLSAYCEHNRRTPSLANAACSEMIAAWCVRHLNLPLPGRCIPLQRTRRPRSGRQTSRAS